MFPQVILLNIKSFRVACLEKHYRSCEVLLLFHESSIKLLKGDEHHYAVVPKSRKRRNLPLSRCKLEGGELSLSDNCVRSLLPYTNDMIVNLVASFRTKVTGNSSMKRKQITQKQNIHLLKRNVNYHHQTQNILLES